jgi:hypothetical protein
MYEEDKIAKDYKTGKNFTYSAFYVQFPNLKVWFKVKGTARDYLRLAIDSKTDLQLFVKKESAEKEDGTIFEYDKLYTIVHDKSLGDLEVTLKAADSFARNLIVAAINKQ